MNFKRINKYVGALAVLAIACSGCQRDPNDTGWEFAPNMYRPVGYEPFKQVEQNPINPMGMNMREPVAGTVARQHYTNVGGEELGGGDSTAAVNQSSPLEQGPDIMVYNVSKDSLETASRVLRNPVPLNEKTLAEGKILYERYCQHCHGAEGEGNGLVGEVYKGVPNYKADVYQTMTDGHVFHVITHGKGRMWPHKSQVTPEERWEIVHYVQQLKKGS
ncbi:cytochrome c [Telluribacter sp.]|jgi:cytochrome c5|uniref:c-type cytochrome n=1 Tax=Telluribacter sp. TaxID=1978767 RepID=UPI002E140358|nr:cytochrome c [Telluribacter sp.]